MNISGIRPYAGFYEYNSIRADELRSQQIAEAGAVVPSQQQEPEVLNAAPVEQNFSSYDFAQTYRQGETYDLKGAESDIETLDMQKAVSDLDKDQVLQQYQYFVGNNDSVVKKPVDMVQQNLRTGENFSL